MATCDTRLPPLVAISGAEHEAHEELARTHEHCRPLPATEWPHAWCLQENHAAKVVAFQAWVAVGSADEPPEIAGIAHVFEHMLFKGTARRGVGQIAQEVEAAGGEINAWTSFDQTVYHLVLAVALLRHRARHPGRRAAELVVRSAGAGARAQGSPRRGQAGRGQPVARRHAGALRRRLLAPSLSPPGDRLHQDRQVVHARAAARLLPPLVRRQQRHAGGGRRLRRQARAGGHRRGVGQDGVAPAGRAPSRKEPAQKAARAKVVTQDVRETQVGVAFHIPGIHHDDTARARRRSPSSSGRATRRG